ncbi:hypothetical protein MRB53_019671 [Persea americana]|uniref:Uncharacterized protein n=1 Tax=Persea americana TaxID=3435 RepID=A0ACC2KYR8_PERAE|nr:hypothetical protein MRB53_019671 [Persea americana]|eukprot:TRINITY_DN2259_c2_g1_i1.p1 TRINITY_DN2259_c2_g1~~TRINITY_DN2259_c2_g1_i1.p1  ORF type:complete len:271 (-),score=57.03 TRINITY_DN2259_c2_g1_i1:365-1177(-)
MVDSRGDIPKLLESMNYVAPSFHFQQGDEMYFQNPISLLQQQQQQQQAIQDMFVVGPSVGVEDRHPAVKVPTTQRRNMGAPVPINEDPNDDTRNNKKRKIIHRDVERQRRHEMAMLYSSLRSLLPIEYLKGKRSISDHMNEAANYIKHQQKKIKEMTERRDALRRIVLPPSSDPAALHMNGDFPAPSVAVAPCLVGVEVMIGSVSLLDGVPLAMVIQALEEEEGLPVLSCVFTNVNEQLIYTLQCQIDDQRELDLHGLQQKLMDLILPSS